MNTQRNRVGGSFRDPSGFVYRHNGVLLRQVNDRYKDNYELLMSSGLYADLVERQWLVEHDEVEQNSAGYKTLKPRLVPYVSYPYEWCFSQLKDAALLTLDIQRTSLKHGMTLKDASAYNVQFTGCRPVFIDTLSFERYEDGTPWRAYGQFCRHFIGPLALMARSDVRLRQLLLGYLDGLPLDLANRLLPRRARLNYGLFAHISMHARSQARHQDTADGDTQVSAPRAHLSKTMHLALIESLKKTVQKLRLPRLETEWGDYYEETNYSADSMNFKERAVLDLATELFADAVTVHDLGANTGRFSRIVASSDRMVVSHDIDVLAVERNYLSLRRDCTSGVLPLILDLTNPSPAIGWALNERESLMERVSDHSVLALALIHHLAIGNNTPLPEIASFFGRIARTLIIEFVPKEDSQVRRMLATREDVFPDYDEQNFLSAFEQYFNIERRVPVEGSSRTLFGMSRRPSAT